MSICRVSAAGQQLFAAFRPLRIHSNGRSRAASDGAQGLALSGDASDCFRGLERAIARVRNGNLLTVRQVLRSAERPSSSRVEAQAEDWNKVQLGGIGSREARPGEAA